MQSTAAANHGDRQCGAGKHVSQRIAGQVRQKCTAQDENRWLRSASIAALRLCVHILLSRDLFSHSVLEALSDRYGSHVLEAIFFRMPALLAAEEAAALDSDDTEIAAAAPAAGPTPAQRASEARAASAWRNVGTHSEANIASARPSQPLRGHLFRMLLLAAPRWIELAQHAHASFGLRHLLHLAVGESNLRALYDPNAPTSTPQSGAQPTVPSYLHGLEELLPLGVQLLLAAPSESVEECTRSASAVPVLQALLRSMHRLVLAYGSDSAAGSAVRAQMQAVMAKMLRFKGSDDEWTPENTTQAAKKSAQRTSCVVQC